MYAIFHKFIRNDDGATAIEYALIAGFIGLTIITSATLVGVELTGIFNAVVNGFK